MVCKKTFPIDITTVSEYGVADWQAGCFWPVSNNTQLRIEADLEAVIKNTIANLPDTLAGTSLRICYKLMWHYSFLLHGLLVLERLKQMGNPVQNG